jgi:hypothetical protein
MNGFRWRSDAAATTPGGLASAPADLGHVCAITTDSLAALASGFARLISVELVRRSTLMRGTPALACDFALFLRIHLGEPARSGASPAGLILSLCHCDLLMLENGTLFHARTSPVHIGNAIGSVRKPSGLCHTSVACFRLVQTHRVIARSSLIMRTGCGKFRF